MDRTEARDFAVEAHGAQVYGDDQPYVHHLSAVVDVLSAWTTDPELIDAAWLHDTLEDTDVTRDALASRFGARVAALVWAVTAEGDDRPAKMAAIYRKIAATPDAAWVKLADRVANVEAAPAGSRHQERYRREAPGFEAAIRPHVSEAAWERLSLAY